VYAVEAKKEIPDLAATTGGENGQVEARLLLHGFGWDRRYCLANSLWVPDEN